MNDGDRGYDKRPTRDIIEDLIETCIETGLAGGLEGSSLAHYVSNALFDWMDENSSEGEHWDISPPSFPLEFKAPPCLPP